MTNPHFSVYFIPYPTWLDVLYNGALVLGCPTIFIPQPWKAGGVLSSPCWAGNMDTQLFECDHLRMK